MVRHEQDREDILRESTALVERVELAIPAFHDSVVVGFRRNGCLSCYFGADPVFQFNSQGQLRRGYLGGRLIKAERGHLVWLDRRRDEHEVALKSSVMTPEETATLLALVERHLADILSALTQDVGRFLGQEPPMGQVVSRLQTWLEEHATRISIANQPNAV